MTGEERSMDHPPVVLDLEVLELEFAAKPGCGSSSSTHPHCTCPVFVTVDD